MEDPIIGLWTNGHMWIYCMWLNPITVALVQHKTVPVLIQQLQRWIKSPILDWRFILV